MLADDRFRRPKWRLPTTKGRRSERRNGLGAGCEFPQTGLQEEARRDAGDESFCYVARIDAGSARGLEGEGGRGML